MQTLVVTLLYYSRPCESRAYVTMKRVVALFWSLSQ
jgi:hypothetical protein